MIPEDKSAAVARGLSEAFGVTAPEAIERITRGLSSDLIFRIVVRGQPYLLRVMTRMDERLDPARIFASMTAASNAGLTPRVRYSSVEDGVSITDFVKAVPLPVGQARVLLPEMLRRLHVLPAFPKTFNYVTAHNGFIWRFRKAGLLGTDEIEQVFTRYEQVCAVYPRLDADMVSCHMDLKPENILFDGERVWLVDWQAAFVNDRYFDLAVVANFVATSGEEESSYLERYFGEPADEFQDAKFFLMRQVVHMFYGAIMILFGCAGKPFRRPDSVPSFGDFHRRVWAGEVDLADNEARIVYGLVHWARLMENVRERRFADALEIVSERNRKQDGFRALLPSAPA